MTSDAAARRLLAGLVDEQALETEPIADVRADLAALGLDSTHAVVFARRLAAGAANPAATLLGRIEEAEQNDDEIHRLEQADIAAVRRNLAEGTTAATIANAQRAAGRQATVVGLRRRRPRRLIYGLGGVAAALAASVVLYVGLSSTQYQYRLRDEVAGLTETGAVRTRADQTASAPVTPPAEEPYRTVVEPQALREKSVDAESASAGPLAKSEADSDGAAGGASDLAAAGMAGSSQERADEQEAGRTLQSFNQPAASGTQTSSSLTTVANQISVGELRAAVQAKDASLLFGLVQPVTELLIVNPHLMPPDVKQEDYRIGNLRARLDEARHAAIGRSIVALVTIRGADRSHDAVVIVQPFEKDPDAGEQKAQEQLVDAIRARRAYQIIELDDR